MTCRSLCSLMLFVLWLPGVASAQNTLTHSNSLDVTQAGIACGNTNFGYTGENHYWRVFDLADFNVTGAYVITSIDMGIGDLELGGTTQTSTVRIHTLNGNFELANLTLVHEEQVALTEGLALSLYNVPIDNVTIPSGSTFVVEWEPVDGTPTESHGPLVVNFGANSAGQSAPTYIYAPDCGSGGPTDLAAVGFPNSHWVLAVNSDVTTATEEQPAALAFSLGQNYPNPYAGKTTIPFTLEKAGHVRIGVYDLLGREVAALADAVHPAGTHAVNFDARSLPGGLYIYRINVDGRMQTRQMAVVP